MEQTAPTVTLPKGISRTGVHWVRPEIVVETSFTEWTKDVMLRHPSYLGERLDNPAKDVVLDCALSPSAKSTYWAKAKRHRGFRLCPREPADLCSLSLYDALSR
jgi:bifunctional non-homologous end joining protein LigD